MSKRTRNLHLHLNVTQDEKDLVVERAKSANLSNVSAYVLSMALNGYILRLNIEEITEMNRLLGNATNNINQIARRVNETGKIYATDIEDIKRQQQLLFEQNGQILKRLTEL